MTKYTTKIDKEDLKTIDKQLQKSIRKMREARIEKMHREFAKVDRKIKAMIEEENPILYWLYNHFKFSWLRNFIINRLDIKIVEKSAIQSIELTVYKGNEQRFKIIKRYKNEF